MKEDERYIERRKKERRVTSVMKRSLYLVFFVILVFSGFLIGRLVYLNNVNGDRYAKAVLSQQSYTSSVIKAERGKIYDRNGIILARSEKKYNMVIDPAVILSKDYYVKPTLTALEEIFGYPPEVIRELVDDNPKSSYIVYEKDVPYSKVSAFNSYKSSHKFVVGVWFEEEFERVYPYSTLASHVIGFTTKAGVGSYGLEEYYDEELTGVDGQTGGYYDSELNSTKIIKDAIDGNDLYSTLDYNIQTVVEEKVSDFIENTGCKNIGVIVMDPNSGDILSMASNREYDLNNPRSLDEFYDATELEAMDDQKKLNALYSVWRNFCVSDSYEPGSTFKTITVASALEEDAVLTTDSFTCNGYTEIGGWRIGCNNKNGHGNLSLAQSLMKSCNCALMEIAAKLGPDKFFEYQKRFGFGKKTGIDIVGETTGIVISRDKLNPTELATSSFGTTFNVSMIQMAAAYSSIVNGGTYYTPHLVKEIRTSRGGMVSVSDDTAIRETVSRTTSEFIRNALYMTVESGTATPAKVEGYLIGGKTGTAQKRPRDEKKYVVSFAGFAPVNDLQVLVYIVIDEVYDQALSGSSSPATRMCASIMKEILPYLGVYPDGDIEYTVNLDLLIDDYDEEGDEGNPDVLPDGLDE